MFYLGLNNNWLLMLDFCLWFSHCWLFHFRLYNHRLFVFDFRVNDNWLFMLNLRLNEDLFFFFEYMLIYYRLLLLDL
jgi:hypothetical protein